MKTGVDLKSVAKAAGLVLLAGILAPSSARAELNAADEFAASWDLCTAATYSVEHEARIPKSLLTAISIAESGRRDELNKTNVAWPWTVTSGSRQWYLDSKAEAVAHVKSMIRAGERNIDVGCMQVNLYYHGDAFASLETAFDPLSNVSYAASFLRKLRSNTVDWITAAGNYHSATPEYHNRYREKIARIWRAERRNYAQNAIKAHDRAGLLFISSEIVPIDQDRTAKLNDAFKRRQEEEAQQFAMATMSDDTGVASGATAASDWRTAYLTQAGQSNTYALQAQINRVRKQSDRKNEINQLVREHENISADKRASDLDAWRDMYSQAINGPSMLNLLSGGFQ